MAIDTQPQDSDIQNKAPAAQTEAEVDHNNDPGSSSYSKNETPPPDASRVDPTLTSTPVAQKATNNHAFASEMQERRKMNVNLGHETKGHWLGAMPAQQFLDKYLPMESEFQEPSEDRLEGCFNSVASQLEKGMYTPLVRAIEPHLVDMVIWDTHAHKDPERDRLSPDVALYHKTERPTSGEGRTCFPKMSTFIELKKSKAADPFIDPPDETPIPSDFLFERQSHKDHQENRGQISSYSAAISGSQFRVHLFSVSVCGRTARFIRWDRSGAIVSRSFDYTKSPRLLVGFFWRYSRLSRHQQGYDTTVSDGSPEEMRKLEAAGFKERMEKANKDHRIFRKLMVPERDDPSEKKEKPFLVSYPPFYDTRSPFSRATRAMLAFDLTSGKLVFLKDYWRPNVSGMEKEGEIYRTLQENNVPHIAPFGMGNDVRDHETVVHTWTASTNVPWVTPTPGPIYLRHYRMTLEVVGHGLTHFRSSHQFVSAMADAMEAHDGAFFDCSILHRDISVGNVIITDESEGLLIDWDLCIRLDKDKDKEKVTARRPARTGTWQFMSSMLLDKPSMRHTHHDDRESAFYVLLWVALRYTKTEATPNSTFTPAKILRTFDDAFVDTAGRVLGGAAKSGLLAHYSHQGLRFSERPRLDELMKEFARVLHARYDPPTEEELKELEEEIADGAPQKTLAKLVAYKHQDRMMKLEMRGWLVDTIRHYLALGKWPEDKAQAQLTIPGLKRKAESDQATLDERATKKHSSLRPSYSSLRQ